MSEDGLRKLLERLADACGGLSRSGGGGHAGEVEVVEVLQLQVLSLLALLVQKCKYSRCAPQGNSRITSTAASLVSSLKKGGIAKVEL